MPSYQKAILKLARLYVKKDMNITPFRLPVPENKKTRLRRSFLFGGEGGRLSKSDNLALFDTNATPAEIVTELDRGQGVNP